MAQKCCPPFFTGTAQFLTFYMMYGRNYVRAKSSLTAERVKTDPCFAPTMRQASIMARASKIGAAAYATIPTFCREYRHYRMLTGKANLLLKQGLHEEEIAAKLIEKYILPIRQQALREGRRERNKAEKKKRRPSLKPTWLRHHRRLRIVEWSIYPGSPSAFPTAAVDSLLEAVLQQTSAEASPATFGNNLRSPKGLITI